jgi:hypothetical protein
MLGPLEDILGDPAGPGPGDRDLVEMAHRNAERLLRQVNTLLDFSSDRDAAGGLRPEPADLAALTAELAGLFRVAVERGGLRLELDCPPLPGPVWVDRDMWEKVVLNLLSNAFKFTMDGGITVSVDVFAGQARVRVSDTGAGIPEAELPYLFDRFHRVATAAARSDEGSGIGLSLVRDLVRRHDGTVTVTSAVGTGSTFTVLLPFGGPPLSGVPAAAQVAPAQAASVQPAAYVQEALSWVPAADGPGSAGPPEVLIVDDNADMRARLARTLAPDATGELNDSLDPRQISQALARHLVPAFAAGCTIRLRGDGTGQATLQTPAPRTPAGRPAASGEPAGTPAHAAGGDWYDAFHIPPRPGRAAGTSLAVAIRDITGHDMRAATIMSQVRSMLRQAVLDHPALGPQAAVTALERAIQALPIDATGTLLLGRLDRMDTSWTFTWSNAGHPPPMLGHPDGTTEELHHHDPMLYPGFAGLPRTERRWQLAPGTTILLYTDGLTDRPDRPGSDVKGGLQRIAAVLAAHRDQPLDKLLNAVAQIAGPRPADDIALLAIRVG